MSNLDFNSLFGDSKLEVTCPKCHSKFPFAVKEVGSSVICPHCSSPIDLVKDKSFDKSVKSVNNSLKDLEDTLKNFGK